MDLGNFFALEEREDVEYYISCSDLQLLKRLDYYELMFSEITLQLLDEVRRQYQEYEEDYTLILDSEEGYTSDDHPELTHDVDFLNMCDFN